MQWLQGLLGGWNEDVDVEIRKLTLEYGKIPYFIFTWYTLLRNQRPKLWCSRVFWLLAALFCRVLGIAPSELHSLSNVPTASCRCKCSLLYAAPQCSALNNKHNVMQLKSVLMKKTECVSHTWKSHTQNFVLAVAMRQNLTFLKNSQSTHYPFRISNWNDRKHRTFKLWQKPWHLFAIWLWGNR